MLPSLGSGLCLIPACGCFQQRVMLWSIFLENHPQSTGQWFLSWQKSAGSNHPALTVGWMYLFQESLGMDVLAAGCWDCLASCGPPGWAMLPTIPHPPHSKAGDRQGLTQSQGSSRFVSCAGHHMHVVLGTSPGVLLPSGTRSPQPHEWFHRDTGVQEPPHRPCWGLSPPAESTVIASPRGPLCCRDNPTEPSSNAGLEGRWRHSRDPAPRSGLSHLKNPVPLQGWCPGAMHEPSRPQDAFAP